MRDVNAKKKTLSMIATQAVQSLLPLDTVASTAPVPVVQIIARAPAPLISSTQQCILDANIKTSGGNLDTKDLKGKGSTSSKPNTCDSATGTQYQN
ncbi:hypothetical protein GGF41_002998 [Coemansia sp. RSA 2531]|nr:hypothetical protein GGF41_002998 [Coemansia sp. RSA 2531]